MIFDSVRIALYKYQLRKEYIRYREAIDSYSSGESFTIEISPSLARSRAKCNKLIEKLVRLDPSFPAVQIF